MSKVLVLRSLTVTKEEAAVLRVALALLKERADNHLSREGKTTLKGLTLKAEDLLERFPA